MSKKTWNFEELGLIPMSEWNSKKILAEFEGKKYTADDLKKLPYFCYGSNLLVKQMKSRCPDSQPLIKCTLKDYKLIFRTVADITKHRGSEVQGALYRLSKDDILRLNRFEGYPYKYIIKIGRVNVRKNKTVLAFWYEIKNKKSHLTKEPKMDYLSKIVRGYNDWNLKDDCILEAVKRVQISVKQRYRRRAIQNLENFKKIFTIT